MLINGAMINGAALNAASGGLSILESLPVSWIATRYRCYLTGAPDDVATDLELPISSFQTRLRRSGNSVVTVVVKGADAYMDEIAERPSGMLQVWREYVLSDGTVASFLMIEAAFDDLATYAGGRAGVTGTLTGIGPFAPEIPETLTLNNPIYYSTSGGRRRYRCELDPRLRPGYTALINGETLVVETIVHIVDVKTTIMEIAEA